MPIKVTQPPNSAHMKTRTKASVGPTSKEGQERRAIYKAVWKRIAHAKDAGCWLEVITLAESVIADRLEARFAHIGGQSASARTIPTSANVAAKRLLEYPHEKDESESALYEEVRAWMSDRNAALHQMAKLLDGSNDAWSVRYDAARSTALKGERLARRTSALVRRLNRGGSGILHTGLGGVSA